MTCSVNINQPLFLAYQHLHNAPMNGVIIISEIEAIYWTNNMGSFLLRLVSYYHLVS